MVVVLEVFAPSTALAVAAKAGFMLKVWAVNMRGL
jgi:hypothetical protein